MKKILFRIDESFQMTCPGGVIGTVVLRICSVLLLLQSVFCKFTIILRYQLRIKYMVHTVYQRLPYFGTLKETGREEDQKTAGEDQ